MAAIEGISGAGMTYQGSTSTTEMKTETQVKRENTETLAVSESTEARTINIDTKSTSGDGSGDANQQNAQSQQAQQSQIKKAVAEINKAQMANSEAIFGIHEETGRVTIKIVDKDTKEVVREYPPEKTLDMIAKVWEMAGLMVDERR